MRRSHTCGKAGDENVSGISPHGKLARAAIGWKGETLRVAGCGSARPKRSATPKNHNNNNNNNKEATYR